jgi:RND family efflux transporter MFP subunit
MAFSAGVVLLMLWLAGRFAPKVPLGTAEARAEPSRIEGRVVPVRRIKLPVWESAVGTIRAVHETTIGSKLMARVVEVNLKAGQEVKTGDILVRLDDTDLRAKLQQAKAALTAAEAVHSQAKVDEKRYAELVRQNAVSRQQYEQTATALRSAEAELRRVQESVNEVQAMLDWATVRAPIDGVVIDKKVDAGDMVTPGQVLVTLYDPDRMQLVASVRESLTRRLQVGQDIGVHIDGLDKRCSGAISEIVPEAQAASRTFQVKVTGPCPSGIYTGMFGRLLIPLDEEQVLVIPREAVRKVGQLELVDVVDGGRASRRAIRTGRTLDGDVEVLSGLRETEQVVIPGAAAPEKEAAHG